MKRLLVVTEDASLVSRLQAEAAEGRWEILAVRERVETLRALYRYAVDTVVIDLETTGAHTAWVICEHIHDTSDVPVLVLVSGRPNEQPLTALRHGADDAALREVTTAEIMARAANLAQHYDGNKDGSPVMIRDGVLIFDVTLQQVCCRGKVVNLTPVESQLLLRFLREPDRSLTVTELAEALWPDSGINDGRTVKVYIHRLRRKLQACDPDRQYIYNDRTIGYRFHGRSAAVLECNSERVSSPG